MMNRQYEIEMENRKMLKQQAESISQIEKQIIKINRFIGNSNEGVKNSRFKSESMKSCRTKRSIDKSVLNCIEERKKVINQCKFVCYIRTDPSYQRSTRIQAVKETFEILYARTVNTLIFIIINNMQNEYIDLPINIQQTPKQVLEKAPAYKVPESPEDAADQLLKTLETLIKGSATDLYIFYQTAMPATLKAHFTDK